MAATEGSRRSGALLAAALALPGVTLGSAAVHAQTVPEAGFVQFKFLDYRDWQPGARRMRVDNPGVYALMPLSDSLFVEGSLVYDGMSGASPLYFNALSGASGEGVRDYRTAGEAKITKVFERFSIGAGGAYSHERDYVSRAATIDFRMWTEDRNRTYAIAISAAADRIHTEAGAADHERKRVLELLIGVTQAITPTLILQSNLTWSRGRGYFDDPYKLLDRRPDRRRVIAWLTRANQHFPAVDGTLKLAYRYIDDSFGADSHMIEAAWVQPLSREWTVTPSLRYASQRAAAFFHGPPLLSGFRPGDFYTADARLAAFGAFTPGVLVAKRFDGGWVADLKVEFYRQKGAWRLGGQGSEGLLPLSARWIQVGVGRTF